ncbi:MAG: bacterioopsin transcriptional activator [Metallosphaera javensis (ex Sakai et al. 2022)]|nr:MAG: bacterioopsin transcriptional activator [Metallosphaera javensis (ex Sakai et al. 2022)]
MIKVSPLLLRVKGPLEVELYVRRSDCRVMQVMGETHTVIEKISPKTGFTDHLIKTEVSPELKKELRDKGVRVINVGDSRIWARAPSCSACRFFTGSDAMILNAWPLSKEEIVYRLLVPSMGYLKEMLSELNRLNMKPRVLRSREAVENDTGLTPRQLQALVLAYKKGFFNVERKSSLTDLANTMGIKPSSAEELLRRALQKVVGEYLKSLERNESQNLNS